MVFRVDDRSVRLDSQFSADHKAFYFLGKAKAVHRDAAQGRTFYGSSNPAWPNPDYRGFCSSRSGPHPRPPVASMWVVSP